MIKPVCLILWILLLFKVTHAQEPAVQQTIEDMVESFGSESDETVDFQEIIDDLTYLSQHPLSINRANKDELQRLHFLSDLQIADLMAYRTKTGQIYTIYELASVEGFNTLLLQKLKPFISFEIVEAVSKYRQSENDIIIRSTRSFSGSPDETQTTNYEGSMERVYVRFKHQSDRFEYGMVAEKDPGEALFNGSNKHGFDYMGIYGNVKITSNAKLFIGDYRVRFGQGLIANQGFSLGKSPETTQVFKFGQEIRSSSSAEENQFFRGIAAKLKWGNIAIMPILSVRQLDAKIDTIDGRPTFGAFQLSGYHRTPSEIAGKDNLKQFVSGGSAGITIQQWTIGLTALHTRFDALLNREDKPENQFLWEGKNHFIAGMDWKGTIRNFFLFGELSANANKGQAFISGILFKPAPNAEVSFVYRNINKTYFSLFANAFTESSRTNDEQGLYVGLKFDPAPRWTISGYADYFNYQWVKYTTAGPSDGTELFAQLNYKASSKANFYIRLFQEEKAAKVNVSNNQYNHSQQVNRYRLNYTHNWSENFHLNTRIEWIDFSKLNNEQGVLISQDINYKPLIRKFSINGRLAYFKTDSYNSRIYAYENDLLYSFSIPALYDKGIRTYLNIKHSFNNNLSVWLKIAATYPLSQVDLENSQGQNTKYEIKFQLRYQF